MSYKDEYEVARLHLDAAFHHWIGAQFEGRPRLTFHLAPPLLSRRDPTTGTPRKIQFGPWIIPLFRALAALRRLRGTALDPFGHTRERRTERHLAREFEAMVREIAAELHPGNRAAAMDLVNAHLEVKGYGHVKERSIARLRERLPALLEAFRNSPPTANRQRVIPIETA